MTAATSDNTPTIIPTISARDKPSDLGDADEDAVGGVVDVGFSVRFEDSEVVVRERNCVESVVL